MDLLAEITVSDGCNKHCDYCFEKGCPVGFAFDEWKPKIAALCEDVGAGKFSGFDGVMLSFWGGEPFLRRDRMEELIDLTSRHGFVSYHVYTNGTLREETAAFVCGQAYKAVADRFSVQVSYDGSPLNEKRRGYGFGEIEEQAKALRDSGAAVSFKATVCYEDAALLPEAWDSYAAMLGEWPDVKFSPTFDSLGAPDGETPGWDETVEALCRREYKFFRRNGRFLMSWFDDEAPVSCRLAGRVFMHTDGVQYVCHGCPCSPDGRFRLGTTASAALRPAEGTGAFPAECAGCDATYCVRCNMAGMPSGSLRDAWNGALAGNGRACWMYKAFGRARRALSYALTGGK